MTDFGKPTNLGVTANTSLSAAVTDARQKWKGDPQVDTFPYAAAAAGQKNTDRELWREREGDYYADSIHVTKGGGIGINCGGRVVVMPIRKWFALAAMNFTRMNELEQIEERIRKVLGMFADETNWKNDRWNASSDPWKLAQKALALDRHEQEIIYVDGMPVARQAAAAEVVDPYGIANTPKPAEVGEWQATAQENARLVLAERNAELMERLKTLKAELVNQQRQFEERTKAAAGIENNATIERCAQVADSFDISTFSGKGVIAAAIRELKDEP